MTAGQIALAWLSHQGDDIVPIPGTKQRTYLEDNVAATAIQLSSEDLDRLEAATPREAVIGGRLPGVASAAQSREP